MYKSLQPCRLPQSSSPAEFYRQLILGKDLVTEDQSRWRFSDFPEVPRRFGKLKMEDLQSFDPNFFQIHGRQAAVLHSSFVQHLPQS